MIKVMKDAINLDEINKVEFTSMNMKIYGKLALEIMIPCMHKQSLKVFNYLLKLALLSILRKI